MSAGMGMSTVVHKHYDWCMFGDQGDNVLDCLNADTGARRFAAIGALSIEGQPLLNVMPATSHDVTGPYI